MLTDRPRLTAGLQLVAMFALTLGVLTLVSVPHVVGGGPWPKLLFLARSLLLVGVATALLRLSGLGWSDVGLRRPAWGRLALAIPVGLLGTFATIWVVRLLQHGASAGRAAGTDYAVFHPLEHHTAEYLFWLFASWTSAAIGEEMLFRGFLLDAARRVFGAGRWSLLAAVLLQAVLFGSLHIYQGLSGAEVATAGGVVLGLVWWGSGRNLWASIVIHGCMDSLAFTVIYLGLLPH